MGGKSSYNIFYEDDEMHVVTKMSAEIFARSCCGSFQMFGSRRMRESMIKVCAASFKLWFPGPRRPSFLLELLYGVRPNFARPMLIRAIPALWAPAGATSQADDSAGYHRRRAFARSVTAPARRQRRAYARSRTTRVALCARETLWSTAVRARARDRPR